MPGSLSADETLFTSPRRASIMGRNSQLVAAALLEEHLDWYNRSADKQGRQGWTTKLMAVGDVGIAVLRLEAKLHERETLTVAGSRPRHFNLEEELHEVGLPTIYLRLEFFVTDVRTPPHMIPIVQRDLVEHVKISLNELEYYSTPRAHPQWFDGSLLQVPRTRSIPGERAVPLSRGVDVLSWSAPLVDHIVRLELRPSAANMGPFNLSEIEVPAVGSHVQKAVPITGLSAASLLAKALYKMRGALNSFLRPPPNTHPSVRSHNRCLAAVQAFLILLLVETEEQATLKATVLREQVPNEDDLTDDQDELLHVWEDECSVRLAPQRAFDFVVQASPEEQHLDTAQYRLLQEWVSLILTQHPDRPQELDPLRRAPVGRVAIDMVTWLAGYWPSLQATSEITADGRPGPRKVAVIRRMMKAFERVHELFEAATPEEMLLQRQHVAQGHQHHLHMHSH
ncbi:hypothetical protein JCM11251_003409 [Rhodosporidiobolus azoricus]